MKELHLTPADDLQNILDSIDEPTTIYLKKGIYRQKIEIKSDDLTMIGEERETTVITYDDYAKKIHTDGKEMVTFRTQTLCVTGKRVKLYNLTVENGNTKPEEVGQCVALSVNADAFVAENVDLRSTQDTLFTAPFPDDLVVRYLGLTPDPNFYRGFIPDRQLFVPGDAVQIFKNCRIYGTVDYVFGCAEAYFVDCKLINIAEKRGHGYVAAPAHSLMQKYGYTFLNCDFIGEGADKQSVHLARPWRDFGKCDFVNCRLGGHINPELFNKWNDTYRDHTARFAYYNLSGAPVAPAAWGKELTGAEAEEIIARTEKKLKQYLG